MNIFIILLGCNIYSILLNRIETTLHFIKNKYNNNNNNNITVTWFLSGGIKNNSGQNNQMSEAYLMKTLLQEKIIDAFTNETEINFVGGWKSYSSNIKNNFKWSFILDEKSTNTAENFLCATKFLNTTSIKYEHVYVGTSDFHFNRASKLLSYFDLSRNYEWILSELEQIDSRYWENIHIQNVYSDYLKATINT
jgi:uncharacterized SAM-binding protein YcdF (DUF218 family)